ncbi:MAG TPA: hypothetical protein VHZ76_08790, partial [Gammaproteobacteria bacterium]|nr:hypothetical protein [Gammaproteobacteria bacterium]
WGKMLETLIAAGAGAAAVVFIDWMVKYYIHKKKNFQEAISIQLALHQILAISLQIRQFYNEKEKYFLNLYSQIKVANNPAEAWLTFRHVDFPIYMNTFDIVKSDWDFTQFLTGKENKIRDVLKHLIPIKLGYQSLLFIIKERNDLLRQVHQEIEKRQVELKEGDNFFYANGVLVSIIGQLMNIRLQDTTKILVGTLDSVIVDSNKSFCVLSEYINKNFCWYVPLSLSISTEMKLVLDQIIEEDNKKKAKK